MMIDACFETHYNLAVQPKDIDNMTQYRVRTAAAQERNIYLPS